MLRKIFSFFGYTLTKTKKSTSIDEIISLRLKHKPAHILLDVGANKGKFTKYFYKKFKKYYLFEPNPKLANELNLKFQDPNIKILNFGTSDVEKQTILNITNDSAISLSSIKDQTEELKNNFRNTKVVEKIDVKIKRLDKYLDTIYLNNEKFFVKIDTQGCDLETLIGLGKYISQVKFIKIEMPCVKLYQTSYNHWDILDFLRKNNFEPVYFENISRTNDGKLIEYDCFFEKNDV
tara:strand:- start:1762 stop:2466 length:705 start_codon:yes stop_codon:yes gene_type:complete